MDPDSRHVTAFACEEGLFEYNVMPMGLTNSPATFQRAMNTILHDGIQRGFILVYLDDILVFSNSLEEHREHMRWLIEQLEANGLRVKSTKCEMLVEEVQFLGHEISHGKIRPLREKTDAIDQCPRPKTLKELQHFLGLAQYYRRFIKNFSSIACPLFELTRKDGVDIKGHLLWDEKAEQAFGELKQALKSSAVLALPDFTKPFFLDTDASGVGVGAVLEQEIDGVRKPIGYFSKHLSAAQRRYSALERELLAIVLAIEHFHHLVFGHELTVFSDHQPLSWVAGAKKLNSRIARWLIRLNVYQFRIVYRKGKLNGNADALSRWPGLEQSPVEEDGDIDYELPEPVINVIVTRAPVRSRINFISAAPYPIDWTTFDQSGDSDIQWIKKLIGENGANKPVVNEFETHMRRELYRSYDKLGIVDGAVYHFDEDSHGVIRKRIVLPATHIGDVIKMVHGTALGGHLGWQKTVAKLRERVFRPGLAALTRKYVEECHQCQITKPFTTLRPRAELQPLKPSQPFELVTADIVGPLPTSNSGNKYILVICDHFSKWSQAYAMANVTAESVAKRIVDYGFAFGLCVNLLTDQGTNFQSQLLREVCELLDIKQVRTSPYHPETDGLTERFNRTLKAMIRATIGEDQKDWDEHLSELCFAYNTATHSSTDCTPFELVYGRKPKLPLDIVLTDATRLDESGTLRPGIASIPVEGTEGIAAMYPDSTEVEIRRNRAGNEESFTEEYVKQLRYRLGVFYEKAAATRDIRVEKQKLQFERNVKPFTYEINDLVLRANKTAKKGVSKKLAPLWLPYPYKVVKILNKVNYAIRRVDVPNSKIVVVHHNNLRRYVGGASVANTSHDQPTQETRLVSTPENTPPVEAATREDRPRGRGRPRLAPQEPVETAAGTEPRRCRGRPRREVQAPIPQKSATREQTVGDGELRRGARERRPPQRLGINY